MKKVKRQTTDIGATFARHIPEEFKNGKKKKGAGARLKWALHESGPPNGQ